MRYPVPVVAAAAALSIVLSGCASCPRDPDQAGFVCGTSNIIGGVYEEDEAALEAELAAAEARAAELEAEVARLEAQKRTLSAERQAATSRLQQANLQLAASIERLAELSRHAGPRLRRSSRSG